MSERPEKLGTAEANLHADKVHVFSWKIAIEIVWEFLISFIDCLWLLETCINFRYSSVFKVQWRQNRSAFKIAEKTFSFLSFFQVFWAKFLNI